MEFRKKYRRFLFGLLTMALAGTGALGYVRAKEEIPDSYVQAEGEPVPDTVNPFVTAEIKSELAEASARSFSGNSYTISYKYLGLIPLKETSVEVRDTACVVPGGIPVGIYMETKGILIIGTGAVTGADGLSYEPAFRLVQGGDYICAVNGVPVSEKEDLIREVNGCKGKEVVLDLDRDGEFLQVKVNAVQTGEKEYKLGIWVRDNTQGIGTLTFLTGKGEFGALGHGINDVDTGTLLRFSEGRLYDTTIIGIHKGRAGTPGELSGLIRYRDSLICGTLTQNSEAGFSEGRLYDTTIIGIHKGRAGTPGELSGLIRYRDSLICGTLTQNSEAGIFGKADARLSSKLGTDMWEVGYKQEIEPGEAWIRSSISGEQKDYRVEIAEIRRNERDVNKGIVLRVTDPELLELTGGIVQGMSGSPILQNGKIIGAVTHVFVQDSAKGFGIFIENMLEHTES